jgi:hypothetical protein
MKATESKFTRIGRFYAEKRGWPVFPIYEPNPDGTCTCGKPTCSSVAKHPRTKNGFKDATTDIGQITEWGAEWPEANIGIRTGKESDIVVIDVDIEGGGMESWEALRRQLDLPDTMEAMTGSGGLHVLFQYPGDRLIKNRQGIRPGIDIRGEGGYIVAPPSRHASGGTYKWKNELR